MQKSAFFRCARGTRKTKKNTNFAPGRKFPREIASRGAHFAHAGGFPRENGAPAATPRRPGARSGIPALGARIRDFPTPGRQIREFPIPGRQIREFQDPALRSGNSRIRLPDPGIPGSERQIREFPDPDGRFPDSRSRKPNSAPETRIPAQKGCFELGRVVVPKTLFWRPKCLFSENPPKTGLFA